uniref:Serpentine receptor class gamma n=1 Tax=Steinernema glaseri TaxID=37863 RepID=A0A1I7Y7Q5_9BILA
MPTFHYPIVAFAFVSSLLNLAIIFGILKYRRSNPYLRGSYFAIVIFHSVTDVLLACEFTILMRARKYRYLDFVLYEGSTLWEVLPRLTNGLHYYLKAVLYIGHVLLSLNRFTSAFYPLSYETFWRSKLMISARFIAWVLPLFCILPVVLNFKFKMWFHMGDDNETVRLESDEVSTQ